MKICAFFGHRDIQVTEEIKDRLKEEVVKLISIGFKSFYFGGFGNFDNLCWEIVTEMKATKPEITRIFCLTDSRHTRANKRPKYLKDSDYEQFVYLDLEYDYWYKRIYYRNCEMINLSDFVIFYAINNKDSGAYKAYKYAIRIKKDHINLANSNDDGI